MRGKTRKRFFSQTQVAEMRDSIKQATFVLSMKMGI